MLKTTLKVNFRIKENFLINKNIKNKKKFKMNNKFKIILEKKLLKHRINKNKIKNLIKNINLKMTKRLIEIQVILLKIQNQKNIKKENSEIMSNK